MAESSGWDGVFIWDHLAYREPGWAVADPYVSIAAIAARTNHLRIGVLLAAMARRRPWKFAREMATLDVLSGGRLIVGVGLGSQAQEEFAAFNEDPDPGRRHELIDEGLDVVCGLWSGQPFSYDGHHYHVAESLFLPTPLQHPRPPIWIGGRWPTRRSFRRAAQFDGTFPTFEGVGHAELPTPEQVKAVVEYIHSHRTGHATGCADASNKDHRRGRMDRRSPALAVGSLRGMLGRGHWLGVLVAVLAVLVAVPSAAAIQRSTPKSKPSCANSRVLLLGSYPSEVSSNLSLEKLDSGQPTTVQGHDFYSGWLERRRVVLGIAGQSPADTYAITELALSRFSCISAVVFEGTAGGGGESGLADVTVPSRWTEDDGQPFADGQSSANISAKALAVAGSIAAKATSELGSTAAVDDGPCACSGLVDSLKLVPTMRSPRVIVGGGGETDNTGASDQCLADGGMLEGCNPCPPGSTPAMVQSGVTAGARTPAAAANMASLAAQEGILVPNAAELLARVTPPSPPTPRAAATHSETASGATYVADDQQSTASMLAAQAHQVPFIAFRGISDTTAVGDLWPFEWLVYQQLAADNAAVAARLWIGAWNARAPIRG